MSCAAIMPSSSSFGPTPISAARVALHLLISRLLVGVECYRRAMIGEQTLEGRRENLSQGAADGMMIVGEGVHRTEPPTKAAAHSTSARRSADGEGTFAGPRGNDEVAP